MVLKTTSDSLVGSSSLLPEWEPNAPAQKVFLLPKDNSYILHQKAKHFLSGIPAEESCLLKLHILKLWRATV